MKSVLHGEPDFQEFLEFFASGGAKSLYKADLTVQTQSSGFLEDVVGKVPTGLKTREHLPSNKRFTLLNGKREMRIYVQICLICAVAFLLSPLRSDGQVESHDISESPTKPTVQGTLSKGSTMSGGSSGGTLKTLGLGTQGTVDKLERGRFLKDRRRSGDFVGTDAGERREFVGVQEASGNSSVRSATSGMKIKNSREANVQYRATTERRNAMYYPRLVVTFDVSRQSPRAIQVGLRRRLADSQHLNWAGPVSITVRGDTAVLSGKVASSHDREMVEIVLMFEPGIAKVENRLKVTTAAQQVNPGQ